MSYDAGLSTARYAKPLHEAFLERASRFKDSETGRHAFGGFLVMRLVDQVSPSDKVSSSFAYQLKATNAFIQELIPPTVEVNHLRELVRVAEASNTTGQPELLVPPLVAYTLWLEHQMLFDEALDVLEVALRLPTEDEEVSLRLQWARLLRLSGRYDDARSAYQLVGTLAEGQGDTHSEMVSRLGYAIVLQKVGNLAASEVVLREVLADAVRLKDREAEGRACHDLAVALHLMNRTKDSVPLAFRAYQLYTNSADRARALNDTGVFLKSLHLYAAAKHALRLVVEGHPAPELRARTLVELLEISALDGDRISFERLRRQLRDRASPLPPDEQVNYEIQVGSGLSLFDRHEQAEAHLRRAIHLAEEHKLGERLFHAERTLKQVRERRPPVDSGTTPANAGLASFESEVQDTVERLEAIQAL